MNTTQANSPMAVSAMSGLTATPQSGTPFLPPRNMFPHGQAGAGGLVTAVSKFPNITDVDRMLTELATQHALHVETDTGRLASAATDLRDKVLGSSTLSMFVGVRAGYLRVFHSAQRFVGDVHDACPQDGKIVAFVGDRKDGLDPRAVIIPEHYFTWHESEFVSSEISLKKFYAKKENKGKFFQPASTDVATKTFLPPLFLIPRGHVEWLLASPCTPWDYFCYLLQKLGPDADNRPEVLKLGLLWCSGATHMCSQDPGKSAAELVNLEEVYLEDNPHLREWAKGRLATTIGVLVGTPQQITYITNNAPPGGGPPPQGWHGTQTASGQPATSTDVSAKLKFSEKQKAALRGFCHTLDDSGIPQVWWELEKLQKDDAYEIRKEINAAMERVRKAMRVDSSEMTEWFFDDPVVKLWRKAKFGPDGKGSGIYSLGDTDESHVSYGVPSDDS